MTLTIPGGTAVWRWLSSAPPAVVLSICLTATSALGGWVYLLAGEVQSQQAVTAVAAEQARAAIATQQAIEARLARIEAKLDRFLEALAGLRVDRRLKDREKP